MVKVEEVLEDNNKMELVCLQLVLEHHYSQIWKIIIRVYKEQLKVILEVDLIVNSNLKDKKWLVIYQK